MREQALKTPSRAWRIAKNKSKEPPCICFEGRGFPLFIKRVDGRRPTMDELVSLDLYIRRFCHKHGLLREGP
ncbi:hypothetical protein LCGC14_2043710 [marine sediment metagenome]|uniref:Uncharacterized protein n=1 Tax=marine sediment metagenome TaxID=412755 RepID=A0A0F9H4J6_9ZZZZ